MSTMSAWPTMPMVKLPTLLPAPSVLTRPEGWKYSVPAGLSVVAAAPLLTAALASPSTPGSATLQLDAGLALAMLRATALVPMLAHTSRRWLIALLWA